MNNHVNANNKRPVVVTEVVTEVVIVVVTVVVTVVTIMIVALIVTGGTGPRRPRARRRTRSLAS